MNTRRARLLREASDADLVRFRTENPLVSIKGFTRAKKAVEALAAGVSRVTVDQRELSAALGELRHAIKKWGSADPELVAPQSMELVSRLQDWNRSCASLVDALRAYLRSEELRTGMARTVDPPTAHGLDFDF